MVIGMVLCMSMYGAIVAVGFNTMALKLYPLCIIRNFVMALPLNLLVVSPLVRFLFIKIPFEKVERTEEENELSSQLEILAEVE